MDPKLGLWHWDGEEGDRLERSLGNRKGGMEGGFQNFGWGDWVSTWYSLVYFNVYHATYFVFLDGVSLCLPGWSAVARSGFTATSASQVQVIFLLQPPD